MIESLLNLLFNKTDIINHRNDDEGELYLRRWFIWPRRPQDDKMVPRLYLHKFYRGDSDRHLHDHPWPYRSLILKGGYTEYRFNPAWQKWKAAEDLGIGNGTWTGNAIRIPEPEQTLSTWYGPGSFLRRGAAWAHSVKLKTDKKGQEEPAWSVIWTGVKCRHWGFHTEYGWCWWKNYSRGTCWCYDIPEDKK